ncbi:F-box/LRR-repeat protein At2g42730-like isoform X3 [Carex rostrata]
MSIPSLNFKLDNNRIGWFVKFVNAVVIRCKPLDLDVFRLSCHKLCSRYEVHERDWICYAVNHNTQVLDLSLYGSMPCYIYTCTSLEELYLNYRNRYSSVQIVNLPNLRKLSISNIACQSYVKNLRSGCPILEFLRVDTFKFTDCVITDERLKYLAILKCKIQKEAQLFVSAPNLLSFSYEGELSLPCKTTLNMPSLSSTCLTSCDLSMIKCFEGMTSCLRFLTHVELLELHFEFCRHKELLTSDLSLELPIFPNLKNVTVAFCMFSCFQMVTCILKSSPNLEKLAILQNVCFFQGEEGASTNESTNVSSTIAIF